MAQLGEVTDFGYRPLYVQVKDRLVRRLIDGRWQPGQLIPSETELAREIGVSQGTIRKALDSMTSENLLVRRQGRGTYVAEPEDSRMLFQFFHLVPDSGDGKFPSSRILASGRGRATASEAKALALDTKAEVWRIERVRLLDRSPMLVETIALPRRRFDGFDALSEIPNNVYRLYSQRWGITIARASERLKAIPATAEDARVLGCREGTPLMEIDRVAYDLEGAPVERRLSRCLTDKVHYISELR